MKCAKKHKYYKNRHKHNFCQDCGTRLRWQGIFTKLFYFFFVLLLIPIAFADINSFPNTVVTKTFNGTVNITTEQDSHEYDCMGNTTNTFIFTLQRNLTTSADVERTLKDFTGNVNTLLATCDQVTKQYGDVNTYFKLYTQCNSDNAICNKDKADCLAKITELTPFKPNYETCSKSLTDTSNSLNQYSNIIIPSIQANLSSMSNELNQSEKSKWLWFFFGIGVMGAVMIIREKKREPSLQRHKTLGLSGGIQR